MGVKTTLDITRENAIRQILSEIMNCSNEQLAQMLEYLPSNELYNFTVSERGTTFCSCIYSDGCLEQKGRFCREKEEII